MLAVAALLESADDAAQRRWLPAIAAGELIATLAIPGTLPGGAGARQRALEVAAQPALEVAAQPALEVAAQPAAMRNPGGQRPDAGNDWVLDGTAGFVLDGHIADLILVPATTPEGTSLFSVRGTAPGLGRTLLRAFDATRKHALLHFSATPATLIGEADSAATAHVFDLGCLALARLRPAADAVRPPDRVVPGGQAQAGERAA